MLQSLNVLFQVLAPSRVEAPSKSVGPVADLDTYRSNLRFIQDKVLPRGWHLNAVQKWDALGHGIRQLAPAAVAEGASISVLYNWEAQAAADAKPKRLLRIKPATFLEAREAAKAGWGMEELVGPGNIKEVQAAAEEAGTDIGVHLYLFQHYGDPWGWEPEDAEDLQGLVASLGPHLQLRGLMTHLNGYQDSDKPALIQRFLSLSCPLAASLAPKGRRLALHFADSSEVLRLLGRGGRMELPQGLCGPDPLAESHLGLPESYGLPSSSTVEGKLPLSRRGEGCRAPTNVEWWARVGRLCYGTDPAVNAGPLGGGVKPVMRWSAAVSQLSWEEVVGHRRLIATVDLSGSTARYPAPGWWAGADAYTASSLNGLAQPEAFVCIHGQQFRLAAVPRGEGRLLRVDVTGAGREVRPGDTVWLLGEGRGLKSLGDEMGADEYNVALCLRGEPPVEGSDWWPPMCCGTF